MKPVIMGFQSRCIHNTIVSLDETGCELCVWLEVLADTKYPIEMVYVGKEGELKRNTNYTVIGFISSGKFAGNGPVPGLLLKAVNNGPVLKTFNPEDFEMVEC